MNLNSCSWMAGSPENSKGDLEGSFTNSPSVKSWSIYYIVFYIEQISAEEMKNKQVLISN